MKLKLARIFIYLGIWLLLFPSAAAAQKEELKLEILNGHSGGGVLSVAVSHDGKFALTGSTDQTALLWDLATGKQLRRFTGHEAAIRSVSFSPDDRLVLTAGDDGIAYLWETTTGRRVRGFKELRNGVLIGHSGAILSAAISTDGKLVATAGEDKTARIWDLQTGKQLFQIEHEGRVNSIAFSPDSTLLLTGGEDKIARLFSTETGKEEKQFVGHTGAITSVAYSPNGAEILTGSYDKTMRLWNEKNSEEIKRFELTEAILSVIFTPNLTDPKEFDVAAGRARGNKEHNEPFDNNLVYFWDKKHNWKSDSLVKYKNYLSAIAIAGNETLTLIATGESEVIVHYEKINKFSLLEGRTSIVSDVAVSPDYKFIVNGSKGDLSGFNSGVPSDYSNYVETSKKSSDLWNLMSGLPASWWKISSAEKSEEKSSVISAKSLLYRRISFSQMNEIEIPNKRTISIRQEVNAVFNEYVAFSPGGSLIAISRANETEIWNYLTAKLLRVIHTKIFLSQTEYSSQVKFSPDSKSLLVCEGNEVALWSVKTGEKLINFHINGGKIITFDFSPDGKTIVLVGDNKTVTLWNIETGYYNFGDFLEPVHSVAFSPDGKTIAAAGGGEVDMQTVGIGNAARANGVRFFDVETGKETDGFGGEFQINSNKFSGFKSVAYSPDGKYLAAGAFDGKVYLRDNQTKELKKFEGHTDAVNSVKFAKDADGKLLVVSGSSDSTTRIWNAATGEEICALVTFRDGNWAVVQTKTGRYDAPNGGEINGIQWVYGTETIALNQLKDIYYTPNLLPRLLGYNKEPLREVPDLKSLKLFPKIVEQTLDEKAARLTLKLQNRGGGIGAVRILINGKQATGDARDERLKNNPNMPEAVVTFDLKGSAGFDPARKNEIEVITSNYDPAIKKGYIDSRGSKIVYVAGEQAETKPPTLYAVIGGVSDYNGTAIDLNFAAKDAEDFAGALELGARRLFCPADNLQCEKVKIKLLTTSGKNASMLPTKANFKQAFADIAKEAKPEDILVVYLSGHGASLTVGDADTYFYLTQEADKASKEALEKKEYRDAATISNDELLEWLTQTEWTAGKKGVQALNQVMILDTCAAGAFEQKIPLQKPRDLSADQIRALERLKDRSGFQILMGSAADQSSYEASQYGQGLLTYALLQGIKGAKLRDGKFIDTQLLFGYAADTVPTIAGGIGGIQKPRIFGAAGIDIGLMNEKDKEAVKLETVKPFVLRPRFASGAEADDPVDLAGTLAEKLKAAGEINPRGDGNEKSAQLVYLADGVLPGAYYVTGSYAADADGKITVTAFLRKDGKTVAAPAAPITGKDADEAAEKLMRFVLEQLERKP